MSEPTLNKKKINTMTKEQKKQLKNLVIPENSSKERIIQLLSTIFDPNTITTSTQLLGNSERCDYVTVKNTDVYIPYKYYYQRFEYCE